VLRVTVAGALVVAAMGAAAAPPPPSPSPSPDIRFGETVEVERVVVDARVVDGAGAPVLGLGKDDFRVRVDGKDVELESVVWIAADSGAEVEATDEGVTVTADPVDPAAAALPETEGRLIVLFFQKDLDSSRAPGLLKMGGRAKEFVATLAPRDRVAVVSFDSHLKAWLDFTTDRRRIDATIDRWLFLPGGRPAAEDEGPSLLGGLDPIDAKNAGGPEEALRLVAEALAPLPGPKTLVMIGWGMGRLTPGGVRMEAGYEEAARALADARVTVFALDVTEADAHSLEAGLQQVAEDTGGFYARMYHFPAQAMRRLTRALAGHYVLTFVKPDLPRGEHTLRVDLRRRGGEVLARRSYVG
jgi:VWFA-related protein